MKELLVAKSAGPSLFDNERIAWIGMRVVSWSQSIVDLCLGQ